VPGAMANWFSYFIGVFMNCSHSGFSKSMVSSSLNRDATVPSCRYAIPSTFTSAWYFPFTFSKFIPVGGTSIATWTCASFGAV
jgi:hypothetical protein